MEGYLTIKEVAERLEVSERTVRRRIKSREIPAELLEGQYGQQYFIPKDFINKTEVITEVVKVNRVHEVQALTATIVKVLDEAFREQNEELKAMRSEVAELKKLLQERELKKPSLLDRLLNKP